MTWKEQSQPADSHVSNQHHLCVNSISVLIHAVGIIISSCGTTVHIEQDKVHKLPLVSISLFLILFGMESGREMF